MSHLPSSDYRSWEGTVSVTLVLIHNDLQVAWQEKTLVAHAPSSNAVTESIIFAILPLLVTTFSSSIISGLGVRNQRTI